MPIQAGLLSRPTARRCDLGRLYRDRPFYYDEHILFGLQAKPRWGVLFGCVLLAFFPSFALKKALSRYRGGLRNVACCVVYNFADISKPPHAIECAFAFAMTGVIHRYVMLVSSQNATYMSIVRQTLQSRSHFCKIYIW